MTIRPFSGPSFGTSDFGEVNLFTIITGASPRRPATLSDLTFQGTTGNGAATNVGLRWLRKSYTLHATTGADGVLYLTVGVWGTDETTRTYYVDALHVTFTEE